MRSKSIFSIVILSIFFYSKAIAQHLQELPIKNIPKSHVGSDDTHQKMMSAYELLQNGSLSIDTFEHIRTILKGLHPGIDKKSEGEKLLKKLVMHRVEYINQEAFQ